MVPGISTGSRVPSTSNQSIIELVSPTRVTGRPGMRAGRRLSDSDFLGRATQVRQDFATGSDRCVLTVCVCMGGGEGHARRGHTFRHRSHETEYYDDQWTLTGMTILHYSIE